MYVAEASSLFRSQARTHTPGPRQHSRSHLRGYFVRVLRPGVLPGPARVPLLRRVSGKVLSICDIAFSPLVCQHTFACIHLPGSTDFHRHTSGGGVSFAGDGAEALIVRKSGLVAQRIPLAEAPSCGQQ